MDDIFDNIFRTLRSGDCATCTSAADRQHLEAPKSAMKMIDDSIRKVSYDQLVARNSL